MAEVRRPQILVVEDDQDVRTLIVRLLSTIADVRDAADGRLAMHAILKGGRPDLIITDLMMPRMDGLEFTRELKKDANLQKIPIIMLTAKGGPKDLVEGINAGARHYMTKPFKPDDLIAKVKKLLGMK